ncbi:hypothetical protein HMPREF0454_00699 [Hafnia alvei ATCC 51873]|uniref:Uncharacterized protein n=1 Tax=Hafnia alvei ATCC 51873 TaxID=1002364 RepID=G9Y288_HAFAL|nr:hypothetical protein HMPREF0454_00699 [Hafnia alvei ATCC 51873]
MIDSALTFQFFICLLSPLCLAADSYGWRCRFQTEKPCRPRHPYSCISIRSMPSEPLT